MKYFEADFLEFFKDLAGNNHKEWFDANRKRYERVVKDPFRAFVADMIDRIAADDPSVKIEPKDAIFRINRDIRFSKDKTPYKTNVSAIISRGGRKDKSTPGIYLELNPENVRIYGGAHMLDKDQLYSVRDYISGHLKEFNKVISAKEFVDKFGEIRGEQNKRIPNEFVEAGEQQPLVFNKQFYYFAKLPPELVLKDELADTLMEHYHASKPVKEYLTRAMGL